MACDVTVNLFNNTFSGKKVLKLISKSGEPVDPIDGLALAIKEDPEFKEQFLKVAHDLTLEGYTVTMPGIFVHSDNEEISDEITTYLDEIHKAKIADADLIYVINVNNYIGESTRDEILWATQLGKKIIYLEDINKDLKEKV